MLRRTPSIICGRLRNEVQVVNTVLSVEQECSPEMTAMFGASLALCVSDIPFNGPIAGVVVGRIDGEYVINPTPEQQEKSDIHLTVAGTKYAVNMVEAGAKEVSEEAMLGAIMFGHEHIKQLVAFQEEIAAAVGKEKMEVKLYTVMKRLIQKYVLILKQQFVKLFLLKRNWNVMAKSMS